MGKYKTELSLYRAYLKNNVATNSMVEQATGIKQKNLCRYKIILQEQGDLVVVYKGLCAVTGYRADYLSTNREIIKRVTENKYSKTLFPIKK